MTITILTYFLLKKLKEVIISKNKNPDPAKFHPDLSLFLAGDKF